MKEEEIQDGEWQFQAELQLVGKQMFCEITSER